MATIEENRSHYETYTWPEAGEEWSRHWGSTRMQWYGSLLPRIRDFVPADTILEIAPGYGRWTAFLKDLCKRLIIVDLTEKCIDRCRQRFGYCSHISYFVNDGKSLEMAADGSIDFIFSFDSLVHAEDVVLKAYVADIARKLGPNGAAFLHHSNLGEYIRRIKVQSELSKVSKLPGLLRRLRLYNDDNLTGQMRAQSMSAVKMASFAEDHNLQCVSQELITWESRCALVDCLSIIVPRRSKWARENRVFRNAGFMAEAKSLSELSRLYEWTIAAPRI
jgi:SAM-dependent methyltransferase